MKHSDPLLTKTLLLSDSSVAIHVTNEQVISEKNKFVLIAHHYVKFVLIAHRAYLHWDGCAAIYLPNAELK